MGHELRTEREWCLVFFRVCEAAAIAAARTMGQGDRKFSDHVAVEAMREVMDTVPMRGRIVSGEGERDAVQEVEKGEGGGGRQKHDILYTEEERGGAAVGGQGGPSQNPVPKSTLL